MGCDYTFAFDSDGAHELTCEKKYLGFPDLMKTNIGETTDTNSHNIDQLYDIPITTPVPHHVEKNVQTIPPSAENTQETTPALEINNNQTPRLYENFYESISTLPVIQKKCLNCMNMVEAGNYTVCFFKHISCKTCQKDMCIACVRNLDGSSKVACKNAWKGCKEILATGDVSSHRDNCEFNTIKCPIDSCGYKGVMELLKTHLIDTHQEALISSNEMSKNMNHKDKVFIFLCYGGIFKCSYYFFKSYVEICVVYYGSCARASDFSFEISSQIEEKTIVKQSECSNWNDSMLSSGIMLTKEELEELMGPNAKKFNFVLNLRINAQA